MNILQDLYTAAKKNLKKIVLPEAYDERTLKAANIVEKEKLAQIILLGNKEIIDEKAKNLDLPYIKNLNIINPECCDKQEEYARQLYAIRKSKGLSLEN